MFQLYVIRLSLIYIQLPNQIQELLFIYFDYKLKSSEIPGSLFNSLIITVCIKNFQTPTQCVKSLL